MRQRRAVPVPSLPGSFRLSVGAAVEQAVLAARWPVSVAEVLDALDCRGYRWPVRAVRAALYRLVRNGRLRRVEEEGVRFARP